MGRRISANIELWPAERSVLSIALVALALDLFQIAFRGIEVDWGGYGFVVAVAAATFAAGQFYRVSGRSERLGAALTCTGIMSVFTMSITIFNYLLMPTMRPPIDLLLARIDALVGYHWPDLIAFAAENPGINMVMRTAYISSLPQIAVLVILLGLTGRIRDLHGLLLGVAITGTVAILFWGAFPTHGAKSLYTLPAAIESAANPIVTTEYGRELVRLAREGPGLLSPHEIRGLIGFPSYHAVLALLSIWAARNVRWAFPAFLGLNLLVLPACLMHGGHHLVDLPAGLAVFLIGIVLTERALATHFAAASRPALLAAEFRTG